MITPQGPDFPRRPLPFLNLSFGPSVTWEKECVTFVRGTPEFGSTALFLPDILMIMILMMGGTAF